MSTKNATGDSPPSSDDTQTSDPGAIDAEAVEGQVEKIRESLRRLMREQRMSQREVEIRCDWTRGYLSQVLQGRITLTIFHILAVLRAVDEPWPEFFQDLFPTREPLDIDEIRSRLDRYDGLFERLRRQGFLDESDHSIGQARPEL